MCIPWQCQVTMKHILSDCVNAVFLRQTYFNFFYSNIGTYEYRILERNPSFWQNIGFSHNNKFFFFYCHIWLICYVIFDTIPLWLLCINIYIYIYAWIFIDWFLPWIAGKLLMLHKTIFTHSFHFSGGVTTMCCCLCNCLKSNDWSFYKSRSSSR